MPPSGFSRKATEGLLMFVEGCYEDLLAEVKSGKHESFEAAIEYELGQIRKAVSEMHIDEDGHLTKRNAA